MSRYQEMTSRNRPITETRFSEIPSDAKSSESSRYRIMAWVLIGAGGILALASSGPWWSVSI